jgi:lipoprotein-anchoring transpeptidase ErfK/SrfK
MGAKSILIGVGLAVVVALCGCTTGRTFRTFSADYGSVTDASYRIPPVPIYKVDRKYLRQIVPYDDTDELPGTIIVDTGAKVLYYVLGDGKAMRYGIGVGKAGFEWHGTAHVALKREWPDWRPPPQMIVRERKKGRILPVHMDPGLNNPLGARALYLYNKDGDTGYRLHGSPEWWSIGTAVSAGCIRLMNQDIIDLYNRAEIGAKVIVI